LNIRSREIFYLVFIDVVLILHSLVLGTINLLSVLLSTCVYQTLKHLAFTMIFALGREIEKQNMYRIWRPRGSVRALGALLSQNCGSSSIKVRLNIFYINVIM